MVLAISCSIVYDHISMSTADPMFQSAQEIGKIYQSIIDTRHLCTFFLESATKFIDADRGTLFLAGRENQLWVEANTEGTKEATEELLARAGRTVQDGKPVLEARILTVPLIVRNVPVGVACFIREGGRAEFQQVDLDLAMSLGAQMAGALKNCLLYEDNLKMERLAAIGETVGIVMHEIKNIMQLAQLSYDFICRGVQEDKPNFRDRGIEKMAKAIKDMNGFVWEMLTLTKKYRITPEKSEIPPLLKELENDLGHKVKEQGAVLETVFEDGFPEVEADGRTLYRALLNLVKNAMEAIDHEKESPFIRVSAAVIDERLYELRVEDNGTGMNPEVKAKIFQTFFSTKGTRGTGLGLMIIDRAVRMHFGSVEVESELGKGTAFILKLPRMLPREE